MSAGDWGALADDNEDLIGASPSLTNWVLPEGLGATRDDDDDDDADLTGASPSLTNWVLPAGLVVPVVLEEDEEEDDLTGASPSFTNWVLPAGLGATRDEVDEDDDDDDLTGASPSLTNWVLPAGFVLVLEVLGVVLIGASPPFTNCWWGLTTGYTRAGFCLAGSPKTMFMTEFETSWTAFVTDFVPESMVSSLTHCTCCFCWMGISAAFVRAEGLIGASPSLTNWVFPAGLEATRDDDDEDDDDDADLTGASPSFTNCVLPTGLAVPVVLEEAEEEDDLTGASPSLTNWVFPAGLGATRVDVEDDDEDEDDLIGASPSLTSCVFAVIVPVLAGGLAVVCGLVVRVEVADFSGASPSLVNWVLPEGLGATRDEEVDDDDDDLIGASPSLANWVFVCLGATRDDDDDDLTGASPSFTNCVLPAGLTVLEEAEEDDDDDLIGASPSLSDNRRRRPAFSSCRAFSAKKLE